MGKGSYGLQWGRSLQAAEFWNVLNSRCLQVASMGPQPAGCGILNCGSRSVCDVAASMGPHPAGCVCVCDFNLKGK